MSSSSIKVAIRCRPLLGQERPTGGLDIQNRRILLDSKTYDPDYTFPPTATQDDVFHACRPILQCVKEGMNGTIMVYGQTGTGKTYTMLGNEETEQGLVHRVVAEMLDYVQHKTMDGSQCALTLSMIEIYNERLTDMLSPNGEEEVTLISGFPRFTHKATLCRVSDAIETIRRGLAWRHTAATLMNERSSRSHVVFIFDLEEYNAFTDQTDVAHLFMIDLAGSESLKKSQASGVAAGEAGKINKSLLALKSVFLALSNTNEATRPSHVPYRDSKLTELLQDSIGGTARTLLIACISSVGRDIEETKSTLLYAVKARSIRNAANTEKEKLLVRLRSMEVENQKLRNRLQERVGERGGYYVTKEEHDQTQEMEESYGKMKEAVEQLMQDRQSSDARQHIWESQVKVLHALLEDKAAELQGFKEIYYEALQRFENQAATLQRIVRGGVGEAKEAVQLSFAGNYARLHTWRTELLNALEEPLPTATSVLAEDKAEEDAQLPPPLSQHQPTPQEEREQTTEPSFLNERYSTPPPALPPVQTPTTTTAAAAAVASVGRGTRSLTPPISPMRNGSSNNVSHGQAVSSSASSAVVTIATTAAGTASLGGRMLGASRSARGSTASSMQRVSAASASTSPTRRGARPRLGSAATSANASRRATQTSPSLVACHHPPLLPMAPPAPLPLPTTGTPVISKDQHATEEGEEGCSDAVVVVEAAGQLHPGGGAPPSTLSPPQLPLAISGESSKLPPWSAMLAHHDAKCMRTVRRLNDAVVAMLEECLHAFEQYKSQAEQTEERRRRGLEDVCYRLRSELESHLTQLQRVDAAGERDIRAARGTLGDQLQLRLRLRPTADAAPFQQTLRNACAEVVRHATHAFPHPSTPAQAEAAMDAVVTHVQRCSAGFAVQSLDPLASSAVGLHTSFVGPPATASSSSASSPLVGRAAASSSVGSPVLLDRIAMPRLSPPLPSTGTGAAAGSGQQVARSSAPPAASKDEVGEDENETFALRSSSSPTRDTRSTTVPAMASSLSSCTASQMQRGSARASSLRSSVALSTLPVNGAASRSIGSRRGDEGSLVGRGKRTRSNASSQRGDGSSRRTTASHRALR
jgi:hypothetical protein